VNTLPSKADVRATVRTRQSELDPAWIERASRAIEEQVVQLEIFRSAIALGAYLALPREVQTGPLIADAWTAGKQVGVPAWDEEARRYGIAAWRPGEATRRGRLGIVEPARPVWRDPARLDAMIVPGVGFDAQGGRVGHGAGHIDALLSRACARCVKIGLAFECQVFDRVPMTERDIRLDVIVTERRVLPAAQGRRGN
jgi:5-formyltetrahydrofolate cyclo-ligase